MNLEALAAAVVEAIEAHPPRPDGGYAPEVKAAGLAYALASRAVGETWAVAASRVPISTTTLGKWVRRSAPAGGDALQLVPVEVSEPVQARGPSHPVLVSPSGLRLEGLCVTDALAAFRALA